MKRSLAGVRGILVGVTLLILFLLVTGTGLVRIGFFANGPEDESAVQTSGDMDAEDPIRAFVRERQQLRAMRRAELNEMIHERSTDAETAALARRQLLQLNAWEEAETTIEGVLRARGYPEAVCTVHEDSVNVLLRGAAPTREESAVIHDLVLRETGVTGGNVKIIPVS